MLQTPRAPFPTSPLRFHQWDGMSILQALSHGNQNPMGYPRNPPPGSRDRPSILLTGCCGWERTPKSCPVTRGSHIGVGVRQGGPPRSPPRPPTRSVAGVYQQEDLSNTVYYCSFINLHEAAELTRAVKAVTVSRA